MNQTIRRSTRTGIVMATMLITSTIANAGALDNGWTQMTPAPQPSGQDFVMTGITSPTRDTAIAVGRRWFVSGGTIQFRTWIQRWDGSAWRLMPSPDRETLPVRNFLEDVTATGPNDVWAVGWAGNPARTMIQRFDGTQWSFAFSVSPGATNYLDAVAARSANDVWAAGYMFDTAQARHVPLVLHNSGQGFVQVPFPASAIKCTRDIFLTGISPVPRTETVYATGNCGNGGERGFVARFRNGAWKEVDTFVPERSKLNDIHVRRWNDIYAVGSEETDLGPRSLVMRFDGTRWTRAALPDTGLSLVNSVFARSASDVWAVGAGPSAQPPFAGPLALHYDGTTWRSQPPGGFGNLLGVTISSSGRVYAAGTNTSGALLLTR